MFALNYLFPPCPCSYLVIISIAKYSNSLNVPRRYLIFAIILAFLQYIYRSTCYYSISSYLTMERRILRYNVSIRILQQLWEFFTHDSWFGAKISSINAWWMLLMNLLDKPLDLLNEKKHKCIFWSYLLPTSRCLMQNFHNFFNFEK